MVASASVVRKKRGPRDLIASAICQCGLQVERVKSSAEPQVQLSQHTLSSPMTLGIFFYQHVTSSSREQAKGEEGTGEELTRSDEYARPLVEIIPKRQSTLPRIKLIIPKSLGKKMMICCRRPFPMDSHAGTWPGKSEVVALSFFFLLFFGWDLPVEKILHPGTLPRRCLGGRIGRRHQGRTNK